MYSRILVLMLSLAVSSITSCDKADRLRAQQADLVEKRKEVQEKSQMVESQIRALGPSGMANVTPIESQISKLLEEKTQLLEQASKKQAQATDIQRRWATVDKLLGEFRPKVEQWKAKANP